MADEPETPPSGGDKPAPRRRAPRKTASPAAAETPTRRKRVGKAETAVKDGVTKPVAAVADGAVSAVKAVKPRSTKRATPPAANRKGSGQSTQQKSAPQRSAPQSGQKSAVSKATEKVGGKWGAAAIAGGLAAAGAAAAALLSLKGSTPKSGAKPNPAKGAHQPDGTDSSKSFQAGIADEGTIPKG